MCMWASWNGKKSSCREGVGERPPCPHQSLERMRNFIHNHSHSHSLARALAHDRAISHFKTRHQRGTTASMFHKHHLLSLIHTHSYFSVVTKHTPTLSLLRNLQLWLRTSWVYIFFWEKILPKVSNPRVFVRWKKTLRYSTRLGETKVWTKGFFKIIKIIRSHWKNWPKPDIPRIWKFETQPSKSDIM